jgi:hypothetical protein
MIVRRKNCPRSTIFISKPVWSFLGSKPHLSVKDNDRVFSLRGKEYRVVRAVRQFSSLLRAVRVDGGSQE